MRVHLLGTGAAEGWPAPFCLCPACEEARLRGGPNIRGRSGALVDDDLKIDFGPDTVAQLQRAGRHLAKLRTILFTHQHSDHLVPTELQWMDRPFTVTPADQPIAIHGNAEVIRLIRRAADEGRFQNRFTLQEFAPGDRFVTAAGDEVAALRADHVPGSCVLRIRRKGDGKVLFYGHDSGLFPAATLDALGEGPPLDVALFDCTSGGCHTSNNGHMDLQGVARMVEELRRRGAITPTTRTIATHFSHNGKLLHEELVRALLPHGIEAAYDGMMVTV